MGRSMAVASRWLRLAAHSKPGRRFLTALADRKMSPWVRRSSGLQLSALDSAIPSLCDSIAADFRQRKASLVERQQLRRWDLQISEFSLMIASDSARFPQ